MKTHESRIASEVVISERLASAMLSQAALGLCYSLELLPLSDAERDDLLFLLSAIEQVYLARSIQTGALVGESVTSQVQKIRAGELDQTVNDHKIITALLGLARTVQLLDGQVTPEIKTRLFDLSCRLKILSENHKLAVGRSVLDLVEEVL